MVLKKMVGLALVVALMVFYISSVKRSQKPNLSVAVEATETSPTRLEEATNSDGSLKLVGERNVTGERVSYAFKILDSQQNSSLLLFDVVADSGQAFAIPFNSWSADNKHLYYTKERSERERLLRFQDGWKSV
ncbi:MAG: hypothetical protein UX47_C0005G0043 [Candidatus Collierbacteria bacterium GW2011_GWA2_46_26]|uniref:Uncharacterized protein n=1 Tax=Candidatus Collierbacteria bacterium GW2011_GWA2_46_26 TaxID=1618381 RepID=A0A0G1PKI7_9BACT|nr:MAG: hypothetical protein UW29_C0008G0043 [Candidatus Collierbacteria bacterium GW2011_GWC2_44_13]KKU33241.1 MAG: hypothetical protein UX47_C0005G0043 [Candidatus Collierbacteria bacterium GW2011_GWA2_46_26]